MGLCKIKWHETGIWFEIKCIKDVVRNKEARNEDASFGKMLLKSFGKYSEADYDQRPIDSM